MAVYVCAESVLQHYRRAPFPAAARDAVPRASNLKDAASSFRDVSLHDLTGLCVPAPSEREPLCVLVPRVSDRGRSVRVNASVWGAPLPRGAFRSVQRDIYVSSPEFTFLQMARRLELVPLIALGMELCGTYRREALNGETLYDQPALTTPKDLGAFLNKVGSVHGAKRARRALSYVAPNSASPLETSVYLLLCLPYRLGGYNFPRPVLNAGIRLGKRGREHTLRRSSFPDLYWRKAKLDLECHGKVHELQRTRTEDSMRRKALERMKVEVVELTYDEVRDPKMFRATAIRLAKKLGLRLRLGRADDFSVRERALRSELLPTGPASAHLWNDAPLASPAGDGLDDWMGEELPSEFDSWDAYMASEDPTDL